MGKLFELKKQLDSKQISAQEYYSKWLETCKTRNEKTNGYIEVFENEIQQKAKDFDSGKLQGPLAGLPVGIKDIIGIQGKKLSAASNILENFVAPTSSTVVERLESDGAILTGRCNCDEFAMGSANENSAFGWTRNPYNLKRSAGGSSGGSAAVVAADLAGAALGTDTGGSIRLPAAFCGITGLKPTYGRVSRSGVVAFASSLDQVGPMADDAEDCAMILQSIAGRDHRDATSMNVDVPDYQKQMKAFDWKAKKIGILKEFQTGEGPHVDVQKQAQETLEFFKSQGADVMEFSLPELLLGIAVYYVIAPAEAASNLARYDGVRYGHRATDTQSVRELIVKSRSEGFGKEVKRRIMLGSFSLSSGYYDAYYAKAQYVRSLIQSRLLEFLDRVDFLFCPTSPSTAFELGSMKDPLQVYLTDIYTVAANLAGLPAVSFPTGLASDGEWVGMQLVGRPFAEGDLLGAVYRYQKENSKVQRALAC